jgi:hypothetical protein
MPERLDNQAPTEPLIDFHALNAALVRRHVPQGEYVIVAVRPSVLFVLLSRWRIMAVLGGIGAALCWFDAAVRGDLGSVAMMLRMAILGWLLPITLVAAYNAVDRATRLYLLTDQRAMRVSGIIRQVVIDAPLARVQSAALTARARERVLGLGTPIIATAGSEAGAMAWTMIERPSETLHVLRREIDRARAAARRPGPEQEP